MKPTAATHSITELLNRHNAGEAGALENVFIALYTILLTFLTYLQTSEPSGEIGCANIQFHPNGSTDDVRL